MAKTTNINLRVPTELKQELTQMAEAKNTDLSTLLLDEIFLSLHGHFVKCPKCGKPCFDEREVPIAGKAVAKCQWCGNQFEHDFTHD